LLFFTLTNGLHPFGDTSARVFNIAVRISAGSCLVFFPSDRITLCIAQRDLSDLSGLTKGARCTLSAAKRIEARALVCVSLTDFCAIVRSRLYRLNP
jgi:hypothetical protein